MGTHCSNLPVALTRSTDASLPLTFHAVPTTSYAPITPAELDAVLMRLAELARADGIELRLRITGGAVMMLVFNARKLGTRDVDVLSAQPSDRLAKYAAIIAREHGWPETWLNDSAKKFEQDAAIPDSEDVELRSEPGLLVTRPSLRRLLAWKLARYADDADRDDALELLRHILRETPYDRNDLQTQLEGHLAASERTRMSYNLEDVWELYESA
ncbi:MAG: hypothetical protein RL701_196 [Pseudomonadota bacterium]|jgi:hypothetical protein